MTDWKKSLLTATGYVGFFLFAFLLFFYLTFDAGFLGDWIKQAARQNNLNLTIQNTSLYHLYGLELTGVRLAFPKANPEEPESIVAIDRLVLSPDLAFLVRLLNSFPSGVFPRRGGFSFTAVMGEGKIKGDADWSLPAVEASISIQNHLPLNRNFHLLLPIFITGHRSELLESIKLSGTADGDPIELTIKDLKRPETWSGEVNLELTDPKLSDFKVRGFEIKGLSMKKGELKIAVKDGIAAVETLKLAGEDMPTNLQGKITLKEELGKSIVELKGTLAFSDAYKQQMAVLTSFFPSPAINYQGTLDGLFRPGL